MLGIIMNYIDQTTRFSMKDWKIQYAQASKRLPYGRLGKVPWAYEEKEANEVGKRLPTDHNMKVIEPWKYFAPQMSKSA